MIANLGLFSLIFIIVATFFVSLLTGIQILKRERLNLGLIRGLTLTTAAFAILSILLLGIAFSTDDFSLAYVASHSNTQLPIFFKIAAIWAGHEGSLLFWVLTLSGWAGVISLKDTYKDEYVGRVLWIMNLLIGTFALFTIIASNPFAVSSIIPQEGRDLNPMLQDVGLIFHPPLLYLGYVGFSAVLAFAIAALMTEELEYRWAEYCKSWCITAWSFLTSGIILGSWWAYYELGWGGWWFWDPVENASLLPWLTSTALLHCIIAANDKQQLIKWALSLAIVTFSLSILGTFIVRSGVLTSVHAFAVDPSKGLALLAILLTVLLSSFSLLIIRSERFSSKPLTKFWSKGFMILVAVSLFIIATLIVTLGTFYPMIFELVGLGTISVGAPYFNLLFGPLTLFALMLMGITPFVISNRSWPKSRKSLPTVALISIVLGLVFYRFQYQNISILVAITWCLAMWVILSHIVMLVNTRKLPAKRKSEISLKAWAMSCAHIGIAVVAIGAAMNSEHSFEVNKKLEPTTEIKFLDWTVIHDETALIIGPNYTAERANLMLIKDQDLYLVSPERRHYQVRVMNMSEPAMKWFWHGDIYITMGEKVDEKAYAFRIQYKAYVRWVWFGGLLSIVGGLLILAQRQTKAVRYLSSKRVTSVRYDIKSAVDKGWGDAKEY
ncbi:heme lyase CcmF/NrfE family subunit [Vibrio makurazakiensis]|uniref:heme lyase CcmF/NrfE family subunit n=1 Tax=Vibrio makurazakiensis TaxID=2910250 RepID=UPI003D108971